MSNPKAPFVGVIAHHPGPCPVQGHGDAFHHATVELGLPATEYFRFSGIRSCAKQAGGLCSFWMGGRLALYQINNRPLLDDEYLAATNDSDHAPHVIDLAVMEALRLGGSNPTALWRRTIKACEIEHGGQRLVIPADTLLWLDRWQANRDPQVFPRPEVFDPGNILVLQKSGDQPHAFCTSLLARNRYDINSFSMLNTRRNPRKCPGRLFSVQIQGLLLRELYGHYEVSSTGIDLSLRRYCAMPKPARSGVMTLRLKEGGYADDQHP